MFEIRDKSGKLITETIDGELAVDRLHSLPNASYVQEVLEIRRLVAVKDGSHEASKQEATAPPY